MFNIMKSYRYLLLVLLVIVIGIGAHNLYISKGNSFHTYRTEDVEKISFPHPDSMLVTYQGDKHAYARNEVDSISTQRPNIEAGLLPTNNIYANETFYSDFGTFTCSTVQGQPWTIEFHTAKATGYANSKTTPSESYLISPAYDMSHALQATLSFKYILAYARTNTQNKVLITDRYTGNPSTTKWTDITGQLTSAGYNAQGKIDWYTFANYEQKIPSRFMGESNVVIALYYACTTSSTTWEVKNLQLVLNSKWDEETEKPNVDPNNTNRNLVGPTTNQEMWRLEFPKVKGGDMNLVVTHSTADYGITYSLEWDCTKRANRWTCYQLHEGNSMKNTSRNDAFTEDPDIPYNYCSHNSDYSGSGFSRGHLCPSADRLCSVEQNKQTFYLSNMHPQYSKHNEGLWANLENLVRNRWNQTTYRDTLYIVKAATIDKENQIGSYTTSGLIVPKYFYMAILAVKNGQYKAIALWTEHTNVADTNKHYADYAITIDELEQRTGIDFFCNLPDNIEAQVESTFDTSAWGL